MPSDADLLAMQQMASAMMQTFARDLEILQRKAKDSASSSGGFGMLNTVITGMTRNLLGPVGLAAGFIAIAKSLENVAVSSIQLRNFARDTGFASSNVQDMQQAFRRMGQSMQEANQTISTLGGKLQNLVAFREASELYRTLSQAEGGAVFARRLLELEQAGNRMGSIAEIIKTFNAQTERGKIAMAGYFGVSVSVLEDFSAASARGIKIWQTNQEEAKKYHNMWVDFEIQFGNIWKNISDHGVTAINELTEAFKAEGVAAEDIARGVNTVVDSILAPIKQDIQDVKAIMAWWNSLGPSGGLSGPRSAQGLIAEDIFRKGAGSSGAGRTYGDPGGPDYGPEAPPITWRDRFRRMFMSTDISGRRRSPMQELVASGLAKYQSGVDWLNERDVPGLQEKDKSLIWKLHEAIRPPDIESILDQMMPVNPLLFVKHAASQYARGQEAGNSGSYLFSQQPLANQRLMDRELLDVEKDSNKTLIEIRDAIQRAFGLGDGGGLKATGPGGFRPPQGSGAGPGGSRFGLRRSGSGTLEDDVADTSPPVGILAEQRAGFMKELNDDPALKDIAIDAMAHEGGLQSNLEQLFNYASMRHMTIRQALYSGQYGPMTGRNRDPNMGRNISPQLRARGEAALQRVGAGSNITDYATDQGMVGDPNYATYMANRPYYNMHKVQGAWFSYHGERGRRWAERERALAAQQEADHAREREHLDRATMANRGAFNGNINASVEFLNVPPGVRTRESHEGSVFNRVQIKRTGMARPYTPGAWDHTTMGYE